MFILEGARKKLLATEQKSFLDVEWPIIIERIARLGLDVSELLKSSQQNNKKQD